MSQYKPLNDLACQIAQQWPNLPPELKIKADLVADQIGGGRPPEHRQQMVIAATLRKVHPGGWSAITPEAIGQMVAFGLRQSAQKLQEMGLQKGATDMVIPLKNGRTLYLENKAKGGRVEKHQAVTKKALLEWGHLHRVAWSASEALEIITDLWEV